MRIWIKFTKEQPLRFLSHLDLMRLWQRAIRRARLPVVYSQGFNPHPKMSFAAALPVGVTSEAEYLDVHFDKEITDVDINSLQSVLPNGLTIYGWRPVPTGTAALMALVGAHKWQTSLESVSAVQGRIEQLLQDTELWVERQSKKGVKVVNLRPYIYQLKAAAATNSLEMFLASGSAGGAKPREVLALLELQSHSDVRCTETFLKVNDFLQSPLAVFLEEKEVSVNAKEDYYQL
ncbi:MAG TPA: TIGR03936 family radical SAM-associated protein [Oscillospiraceae bacterium]|nr:TIGR03936 family radical SAM-associated protein [Oscillospiraceae bacterium]